MGDPAVSGGVLTRRLLEEGEVGILAVMFTDVVESTDLLVRVGQSAFDEVRRANDHLTEEAVATHRGELVKRLGDGAMAVFRSASAAVAAAQAIQQQADLWRRASDRPAFQVRVGIAVGEVAAEREDYHGVTVFLARRLEAGAPPGGIWTTAATAVLARDIDPECMTAVGARDFKGLNQRIDVVSVGWVALPDAREPQVRHLPPVVGRGGGMPFAGRTAVLSVLSDAWARAAESGAVVVRANAAIGRGWPNCALRRCVPMADRPGPLIGLQAAVVDAP